MIVFLHLMELDMDTKENKQVIKTLKVKGTPVEGDPCKKFLRNSSVGGQELWHIIKGHWHNQRTPVEVSTKGRGRPGMRNLPEIT